MLLPRCIYIYAGIKSKREREREKKTLFRCTYLDLNPISDWNSNEIKTLVMIMQYHEEFWDRRKTPKSHWRQRHIPVSFSFSSSIRKALALPFARTHNTHNNNTATEVCLATTATWPPPSCDDHQRAGESLWLFDARQQHGLLFIWFSGLTILSISRLIFRKKQ